jgi:hypothetical protein
VATLDLVPSPPTAVIIWSHTEPGWTSTEADARRNQVARLAALLRANGIDVDVDLFHHQGEDWSRWGPEAVRTKDYILALLSPAWRVAWESPQRGGASMEADVLQNLLYDDRQRFFAKVRLITLPGEDEAVPHGLSGVTRYTVTSFNLAGAEDLLRDLTDQPSYPTSPLGAMPVLPPALGTDDLIDASASRTATPAEQDRLREALEALPTPEPGDDPHLPWLRERERIVAALSEGGTAGRPLAEGSDTNGTATLSFHRLATGSDVAWAGDDQSQLPGFREATLVLHVLAVPSRPRTRRELAELGKQLPEAARALVGPLVQMSLSTEPDRVRLTIGDGSFDRGGWDAPRPARLLEIGVRGDGAVSVHMSLPRDRMGAALYEAQLPSDLETGLRGAATAFTPLPDRVAVAVEIPEPAMLTNPRPGEFGHRSTATMPWSTGGALFRVPPDEAFGAGALSEHVTEAARELTSAIMRHWHAGPPRPTWASST